MRGESGTGGDSFWNKALVQVACYGGWIALSGLGLLVAIQFLNNVPSLALHYSLNNWVIDLWNKVGAVLLLLGWLASVIFLESYLRGGVAQHRLGNRLATALVVELILLGVAMGAALKL